VKIGHQIARSSWPINMEQYLSNGVLGNNNYFQMEFSENPYRIGIRGILQINTPRVVDHIDIIVPRHIRTIWSIMVTTVTKMTDPVTTLKSILTTWKIEANETQNERMTWNFIWPWWRPSSCCQERSQLTSLRESWLISTSGSLVIVLRRPYSSCCSYEPWIYRSLLMEGWYLLTVIYRAGWRNCTTIL